MLLSVFSFFLFSFIIFTYYFYTLYFITFNLILLFILGLQLRMLCPVMERLNLCQSFWLTFLLPFSLVEVPSLVALRRAYVNKFFSLPYIQNGCPIDLNSKESFVELKNLGFSFLDSRIFFSCSLVLLLIFRNYSKDYNVHL